MSKGRGSFYNFCTRNRCALGVHPRGHSTSRCRSMTIIFNHYRQHTWSWANRPMTEQRSGSRRNLGTCAMRAVAPCNACNDLHAVNKVVEAGCCRALISKRNAARSHSLIVMCSLRRCVLTGHELLPAALHQRAITLRRLRLVPLSQIQPSHPTCRIPRCLRLVIVHACVW